MATSAQLKIQMFKCNEYLIQFQDMLCHKLVTHTCYEWHAVHARNWRMDVPPRTNHRSPSIQSLILSANHMLGCAWAVWCQHYIFMYSLHILFVVNNHLYFVGCCIVASVCMLVCVTFKMERTQWKYKNNDKYVNMYRWIPSLCNAFI